MAAFFFYVRIVWFLKNCPFWCSSNLTASNESLFCTRFIRHNTVSHWFSCILSHRCTHASFFSPLKPVSYFSKVSVQCSLVKICQVVFEQASLFQTDDTLLMNFCWQVLTVSCHTRTGTAPSDGFKFTFNFCFIGR